MSGNNSIGQGNYIQKYRNMLQESGFTKDELKSIKDEDIGNIFSKLDAHDGNMDGKLTDEQRENLYKTISKDKIGQERLDDLMKSYEDAVKNKDASVIIDDKSPKSKTSAANDPNKDYMNDNHDWTMIEEKNQKGGASVLKNDAKLQTVDLQSTYAQDKEWQALDKRFKDIENQLITASKNNADNNTISKLNNELALLNTDKYNVETKIREKLGVTPNQITAGDDLMVQNAKKQQIEKLQQAGVQAGDDDNTVLTKLQQLADSKADAAPQAPEQQTPPPEQQTPPPAQQTPPPEQQTPPPAQQTPPPEQQTPPAQQTQPPEQQTPPPAQQTPPPAQQTPPEQQPAPDAQSQAQPAPADSTQANPNAAKVDRTSNPEGEAQPVPEQNPQIAQPQQQEEVLRPPKPWKELKKKEKDDFLSQSIAQKYVNNNPRIQFVTANLNALGLPALGECFKEIRSTCQDKIKIMEDRIKAASPNEKAKLEEEKQILVAEEDKVNDWVKTLTGKKSTFDYILDIGSFFVPGLANFSTNAKTSGILNIIGSVCQYGTNFTTHEPTLPGNIPGIS